jgi:hypothetical protein
VPVGEAHPVEYLLAQERVQRLVADLGEDLAGLIDVLPLLFPLVS